MTTMQTTPAAPLSAEQLDKLQAIADRVDARGLFNASCDIREWIAQARAAAPSIPLGISAYVDENGLTKGSYVATPQATASPAPRVSGQDERALFEAWAIDLPYVEGWSLPRDLPTAHAEIQKLRIKYAEAVAFPPAATPASASGEHLDPNQVQSIADRIRNTPGLPSPSREEAPAAQAVEAPAPCGWLAGSGTAMAEDMYYRLKDAQEECERHNDYERSRSDFDAGDLRTPEPVYRAPAASVAQAEDAKDAARYQFLRHADLDELARIYWPDSEVPEGEELDRVLDAAMASTQHSAKAGEQPLWDDNGEPWNEAAVKVEQASAGAKAGAERGGA